jgi:subtilisin family serine protease
VAVHHVWQQLLLDQATTGRGVRVAILDTGLDLSHPDFTGRVDLASSRSFSSVSDDLNDVAMHGTHVAGIIAGDGRASGGLYPGVAPDAELVVLKISARGRALEGNAIAAIGHAMDVGVDIINYSNGYDPEVGPPPWIWPIEHSGIEEALQEAEKAGILCVVAAGNSGSASGSINRPGGLECVLTVGALEGAGSTMRVYDRSSRGPFRRSRTVPRGTVRRYDHGIDSVDETVRKPDVVAPGQVVSARSRTAVPSDRFEERAREMFETRDPDYVSMTGTSQATAVVSGLAARLISLARQHGVNLGSNPAAILRTLMTRAAMTLNDTREASGRGLILWPLLQQVLKDYHEDGDYRALVDTGEYPKVLR